VAFSAAHVSLHALESFSLLAIRAAKCPDEIAVNERNIFSRRNIRIARRNT